MISVILSLLGTKAGRVAAGAGLGLIVLLGAYIKGHSDGDARGTHRVQVQFDAYKVQVAKDIADEKQRQADAGNDAVKAMQVQLSAAQAEADAAEAKAQQYAAALAARPHVPGRGATKEDADALNR